MSSPQKAREWIDSQIAYGRPAQAYEFLKQAHKKLPSDQGLLAALDRVQKLTHDEVAVRNGPPLFLTWFAGALLLWCCVFAIRGIVEPPWTVKRLWEDKESFECTGKEQLFSQSSGA